LKPRKKFVSDLTSYQILFLKDVTQSLKEMNLVVLDNNIDTVGIPNQ
jgi:hypothetical protein